MGSVFFREQRCVLCVRGGFGRGSLVGCAVMVSVFSSCLYSRCGAEGAEGVHGRSLQALGQSQCLKGMGERER